MQEFRGTLLRILHAKHTLNMYVCKPVEGAEGLEEVGPNFSRPPPRDGRRFVVKVQSMLLRKDVERYTFLLYDRRLELYERIQSKVLANIVQEFGVLCKRVELTKKRFLYCSFEKNEQLRLFINEFSDFLNW